MTGRLSESGLSRGKQSEAEISLQGLLQETLLLAVENFVFNLLRLLVNDLDEGVFFLGYWFSLPALDQHNLYPPPF